MLEIFMIFQTVPDNKKSFFSKLYRRRYDVATQTSFYKRLQDIANPMSLKRRKSDVFKTS